MRARTIRGLRWVLLLGLALRADPAARAAQQEGAQRPRWVEAQGAHRASASLGPHGGELTLKDGFSVRFEWRRARKLAPIALEVVTARPEATDIAPEFVPIGPVVRLSALEEPVAVAYRADAFRVRRGHRLVLALETRAGCAGAGCWELWEAAYAEGRCRATAGRSPGLRMQFGSLPLSASLPLRSAAR